MTVRCGLMSARIRSSAEDGSGCFELLELPPDTLTSVLQKLTYEDLVRVGTTCRTLRQLVDDDMMWIGFCKHWERQLDITTWHPRMKSAKSLFRLLRSFDKLVGSWQAKQEGPRGGLLYITWVDPSTSPKEKNIIVQIMGLFLVAVLCLMSGTNLCLCTFHLAVATSHNCSSNLILCNFI
jgi:hypothetical protein